MSQFIEMFGDFHNKVHIKDVCHVVSGKSIPTKLEDIDGNNPYIKVADFNIPGNEKYITVAQRYVSDDSASYSKQIPKGSVIFAKNGAASMSNKKRLTQIRCYIDMNTMAIFPKNDSILPDFLFATIEAMDVSSHVRQGAIPSISPKSIEDSFIAMPTMEEQYRYISIANQADKSGFDGHKSQFIEMTGDPRTNSKGWPVKTLPELATYSIGLTYKPENISEDGTIVLRSGNIQNSKIDLGDIVRVNCPIKESIYVQKNDILMCSRNGSAALVGKVAMIKDIPEPMTYGAFMTVIRSEYSDYLYLYFQSNDFREQVSTGKSSTMNQITQNMLDKISLPLPDDETRKKLSIILHQADKSGSVLQYRIAC